MATMKDEPLCPKCKRAYPYGDPRAMIQGRQCFECDIASEPHTVGMEAPTVENDPIGRFRKGGI